MLQIFVIADSSTAASALRIVLAIGNAADALHVVAPPEVLPLIPAGVRLITTPPHGGFGGVLAACLAHWDGAAPIVVIRAETTCDDWKGLVTQCRRCHAAITTLGIWSPRTTPSAWQQELVEIRRLSDTISAVAAVDSAVVSLAAPVSDRLRQMRLAADASAEEVWGVVTAFAYARNLLVLQDRLVTAGVSPEATELTTRPATNQAFAADLLPAERRHLDKLGSFISSRRHRPPQIIVDVQVDAGLTGCDTPFDVLERMHAGRSEHHVPPPEQYGVNVVPSVRLTAFYLPQFHRLPVNDHAWESGFTEWTNATRCQPFFRGHLQPHLPADLGFYDLTNPDVVARQTQLALHYGVGAFCFHYYWFGGHVLMPTPLRLFRELDDPHMKFCLCWANETWTKRWDGRESEVILRQSHAHELDRGLIRDILPLLRCGQYLRAHGAAVLVIYRPALLGDDLGRTIESWRRTAEAEGVGPLMILGSNFMEDQPLSAAHLRALDGLVEFSPHGHFGRTVGLSDAVFYRHDFAGSFHDYDDAVSHFSEQAPPDGVVVPGVFPGWDNSARRRAESHIYVNSSPPKFRAWLASALRRSLTSPSCDGMVFINAWNEWAEGAHLEPCRWYGHAHLAACRDAIRDVVGDGAASTP